MKLALRMLIKQLIEKTLPFESNEPMLLTRLPLYHPGGKVLLVLGSLRMADRV